MEQIINNPLVTSIVSRFVKLPGDFPLYDKPGSFRLYKLLNDLLIDYAAIGIMEEIDEDHCKEWLASFRLISDTIFDLETLAAEANNIKAVGPPGG